MFQTSEVTVVRNSDSDGRRKQGSIARKYRRFQLPLILLIAVGLLVKVQASGTLKTIAILSPGRYPELPTVCAIKSGGEQTLSCWDKPGSPLFTPQDAPGSWIGLIAGGTFMCGLQFPNRTAVCWTFDPDTKFSVPDELKPQSYKQIAAGENHVCGIRRDYPSTLDCWNRGGVIAQNVPSIASGVFAQVAAGKDWTCVTFSHVAANNDSDFTSVNITCWNKAGVEQFPVDHEDPSEFLYTYTDISVGDYHICALHTEKDTNTTEGVMNLLRCWMFANHPMDSGLALPFSSEVRGPFMGLVSGSKFTCSLGAYSGEIQCWGVEGPENMQNLRGVQFSSEGLAASKSTVCGVGLNKEFALRSVCAGNSTPAESYLFLNPGICSSKCVETYHYKYDQNYPDLSFGELSKSATLPLCKESDTEIDISVCLPCYSFSCDIPPPHSCGDDVLDHCRKKHTLKPGRIAAIVISSLIIIVLLELFLKSSAAARIYNRLFTGLMSVEHFYLNQEVFNLGLKEFSYKELETATNGFDDESLLGQGSSGCVFKGTLSNRKQVAVKRLGIQEGCTYPEIYTHFDGELKLLARLRHENMVNLVGYCHQRSFRRMCCWKWVIRNSSARVDHRLLVFEHMPNGTLTSHLHRERHANQKVLDWEMRLRIATQTAKGIEYLHFGIEPPIIHRDIKSSNILLDENWNARLSDLGISRLGPVGNRSHISTLPAGTLGYLDPEYYRTQHLTLNSDVYSFGVVLLELLTGCKAIDSRFDPANIVERCVPVILAGQAASILDPAVEPARNLDRLLLVAKIAEACVRMAQNERPTIVDVLLRLEEAAATQPR